MKIKNVAIENYRFFKKEQVFSFDCKNILLYGENGSGKTSLFNALTDFFFYYKNPTQSKKKIKENKNIFSEKEDKPKINITFEDDTSITFEENGFNKEDLKEKIEEVSKSKLFLTYQDIYSLNNIFKKDISYNEFKKIFTILYFEELDNKFKQFDNASKAYNEKLNEYLAKDYLDTYEIIYKEITNFDLGELEHELQPEWKELAEGEVSSEIIFQAYYLPPEKILNLKKLEKYVSLFIELNESLKINIKEDFWLKGEFEKLINNIALFSEDLSNLSDYTVENKIEFEGKSLVDDLSRVLASNLDIIEDYQTMDSLAKEINEILYENLITSKGLMNDILIYLNSNLSIKKIYKKEFIFCKLLDTRISSISFEVELHNKVLKEHWLNLNESKLSALNIAMYLSSVLNKKTDIPILVLDDLLISLDMSNRDKILELLLDRTLDENDTSLFFDDNYQMFILTHDKAFFELAKYRFDSKVSGKWKYFEIYEDTSDNFPSPLLIPSENKLEKTESFIRLGDYASAGNQLRKASEEIIKKKLLNTYLKEIEKPTLDPLIKLYKKMLEDFTFDIPTCILKLEDFTKRVLNPSSHDDLINPIYKKELEDALAVVKELNQLCEIEKRKIIDSGAVLLYELENKYKVRFNFLSDVNLFIYDKKIGNRKNIYLGNCGYAKFESDNWENYYYDGFNSFTLKKAFEVVSYSINKDLGIKVNKEDFINNLKIDNSELNEDIKRVIKKHIT